MRQVTDWGKADAKRTSSKYRDELKRKKSMHITRREVWKCMREAFVLQWNNLDRP